MRTRMRTRARTTDSGSSELLFQLSAAGIEGQMTVGPASESLKEQMGGVIGCSVHCNCRRVDFKAATDCTWNVTRPRALQ